MQLSLIIIISGLGYSGISKFNLWLQHSILGISSCTINFKKVDSDNCVLMKTLLVSAFLPLSQTLSLIVIIIIVCGLTLSKSQCFMVDNYLY